MSSPTSVILLGAEEDDETALFVWFIFVERVVMARYLCLCFLKRIVRREREKVSSYRGNVCLFNLQKENKPFTPDTFIFYLYNSFSFSINKYYKCKVSIFFFKNAKVHSNFI